MNNQKDCTPISKIFEKEGNPIKKKKFGDSYNKQESKKTKDTDKNADKNTDKDADKNNNEILEEAEKLISSEIPNSEQRKEDINSSSTEGGIFGRVLRMKKYILLVIVVVIALIFSTSRIFKHLLRNAFGQSVFTDPLQNTLNAKGNIAQGLLILASLLASRYIFGNISWIS